MLTRRRLLENALRISGAVAFLPQRLLLAEDAQVLSLRLDKSAPIEIPSDFMGLGYEMSSVARTGLLSATNSNYVELVKGLAPAGVLRVGGIVANYTWYEPNGTARADPNNTVITRAILEQFAAFLRKTGWTAIWSVNFAQGTIDEAAQEARAVRDVLGSRLLALEIGNEVDSYGKGQPFRPASYDYQTYRREYNAWHAAIVKAVPGIRFAAPDVARAVNWVERMAGDANGDVQLLTMHYYRNGEKRGSAEQLRLPDPRLKELLASLRIASKQSGIPWRMCEMNSFSGGGLPGVSDTFLGALWTLDTMLLIATYGCSGVNLETGVNQLGFISCYSPIQDNGEGVNTAGVPYYGMLAFATAFAGCHQVLPVEIGSESESLTAYVLGAGGKPRSAVIVNRDRTKSVTVSVSELGMDRASVLCLEAPAAESKTDVTFGGSAVDAAGRWKPKSEKRVHGGKVTIPRMSAAMVRDR